MTLLERINQYRDDLTEGDQSLSRYIAKNYASLAYEPAASIAQKCNVSAATATRFFMKLGYENFAEVQREVREHIEQQLSSPLGRLETRTSVGTSMAELVLQTFHRDTDNLRMAGAGMQASRITGLAEILLQCRGTIYILGEKKAHAIAIYLYAQLNLCLDRVVLLKSENALMADRLLQVEADDVLLIIDVRRYIQSTLRVAETFKERSAQILTIGDSESSPISGIASFGVHCSVEGATLFDSYAALIFIANALSNVIAAQRSAETSKRLKEAERLWERFETFTHRKKNTLS